MQDLHSSSPFGALRHHLRHGVKRVTGFSVAQELPTNLVPLPPRCAVGQQSAGNHLPHKHFNA